MLNQFLGNKAVLVVQFPEIAIQQLSLEFMLNGAGDKTAEFLVAHMLPNPRREFFVHAYRPCEECHTMMLTADIDNSLQIERAPVSIPPLAGHVRPCFSICGVLVVVGDGAGCFAVGDFCLGWGV